MEVEMEQDFVFSMVVLEGDWHGANGDAWLVPVSEEE